MERRGDVRGHYEELAAEYDEHWIYGPDYIPWRQHLTAHGPANELLLAFQNQHRLPARFAEILAEAGDYSRLVQTQESQQISGALGLLTILGLPLGTALGILQVLDDKSVAHLLVSLGLSVAATGAALTTRYGRLVVSSLRGGIGRE